MPTTTMQVQLLTVTPDAEALIYAACKQCTSHDGAADVFSLASNTNNAAYSDHTKMAQEVLIRRVIDSGHTSVVEHVSFSFAVSGVSRALSHQLVRTRIASYSQQSQRYVDVSGGVNVFPYVIPPKIAAIPEAKERYVIAMTQAAVSYQAIRGILVEHGSKESANEDARFVLPNACETKIVVTMNCRALLHFFEERTCARAQWEIRAMAKAMLEICKDKLPVVFAHAGPKCVRQGYCTEHKSCGRYPKLEGNRYV